MGYDKLVGLWESLQRNSNEQHRRRWWKPIQTTLKLSLHLLDGPFWHWWVLASSVGVLLGLGVMGAVVGAMQMVCPAEAPAEASPPGRLVGVDKRPGPGNYRNRVRLAVATACCTRTPSCRRLTGLAKKVSSRWRWLWAGLSSNLSPMGMARDGTLARPPQPATPSVLDAGDSNCQWMWFSVNSGMKVQEERDESATTSLFAAQQAWIASWPKEQHMTKAIFENSELWILLSHKW